MKKNVAGQKVGAQMVSATDGSAFTGSVTVSVTVDAGVQAAGSVGAGACTHEGNGLHTYAPAQAETNGDLVEFTFTGTGAVPATIHVYTAFPQTGDTYAGLSTQAKADVKTQVDASLTTDVIADSIPADGSRPTLAQACYMLTQFMLERSVSATTVTVKKPDGTTTLFTLTLNDAAAPTSITRATQMAYQVNTGIGAVASIQTFVLDGLATNAGAPVIPGILEDLTTLWCQNYEPVLHAAHAAGSGYDDGTLVHADLGNAQAFDGENDLNTAYAKYIDTEF